MKLQDQNGEYSEEEIRRALHGIDNTRRLTFRYERLDRNNNYIEDIDYVESCTISNNVHADIKRTASLEMFDEGRLNFLQDRIKPYVRLEMPKDENYTEKLESLAPAVWYKFDEDALLPGEPEFHDLDEGTDFDTWEEAFRITYEASGTYTFTGVVSREDDPTGQFGGSNRTALWLVYQNTTSSVIQIDNRGVGIASNGTTVGNRQTTFNLYFSPDLDSQPALVDTKTTNNPTFYIGDPRRGYYYLEVYPTPIPESSVNYGEGSLTEFETTFTKTVGLEETGEHNAIGSGANLNLSGPALVGAEGKSLIAPGTWETATELAIPIENGVALNYWQQLQSATDTFNSVTTLETDRGPVTFTASNEPGADGYTGPLTYKNLFKNPSFENPDTRVEVRRNRCVNPAPANLTEWQGTSLEVTTFSDGTPCAQATATGTSTPYIFSADGGTVVPGETYVLSALLEFSKPVDIVFRAHHRGTNQYFNEGIIAEESADGVNRYSIIFTAPAGSETEPIELSLVPRELNGSVLSAGTTFRMGQVLIEKTNVPQDYFDGSTAPESSDFEYSWTGAIGNSESIKTGMRVAELRGAVSEVIQSTEWSNSGTFSMRHIPQYFNPGSGYIDLGQLLLPGKTYTVKVTCRTEEESQTTGRGIRGFYRQNSALVGHQEDLIPTAPGVYPLSITITIPADATDIYIRLYNAEAVGGTHVWWDDLSVVETSNTELAYFDGNTQDNDSWEYTWDGISHKSTSTATYRTPVTFKIEASTTDVNYDPVDYSGQYVMRQELLDTEPHMITFQVSNTGKVEAYWDSTLIGNLTGGPTDNFESFFTNTNRITGLSQVFTGSSFYVDNYSVFARPLGYNEFQNLHRIGLNSRVARRGYVEWPQGVFVLSSPSRVFEDATHVTRSVEAYDQLLVLSEDTYEDRYSVLAGTRYVDAIEAVMQSAISADALSLEDNAWATQGNSDAVKVNDSTVSITSPNKGTPPSIFGNEGPATTRLTTGSTLNNATGQHFISEYTFNKAELKVWAAFGTDPNIVKVSLVRTFDDQVIHSVQKTLTVAAGQSEWVVLDLPVTAQAGEYDIVMHRISNLCDVMATENNPAVIGYSIVNGVDTGTYDALYRVYPGAVYGDYYGSYEASAQEIVAEGAVVSSKVTAGSQVNVLGFIGAHTTTGLIGDPQQIRTTDYLVAYFEVSAGVLRAKVEGTTDWTATYSATTHAFLRVRIENGVVRFETSANGSTWTLRRSYTPNGLGVLVIPAFLAKENTAGSTALFSNIVVDGAYKVHTSGPSLESNEVLGSTREWEPGTSKLTIMNDLLGSINYESAFFDENGILQLIPYTSPTLRPSEYTYATDSESIISGNVDQTIDLFAVPNSWVIIYSDPESEPMVAKYTNDNPLSVTSTVNRGRKIVDVRSETEAPASQAALDAKVMRLAEEASQVYENVKFETAIMPVHQNGDVYNLTIDGLVIEDKFSEQNWSMVLENGGVMQHEVRRSVEI